MSWSDRLPPPLGPTAVPLDDGDDVDGLGGLGDLGDLDGLDRDGAEPGRWWLAMLLGALMVGLGVWMLTNLVESVVVLALIIGVSLITGGLVDAFVLGRERARWAAWSEGILLVLAGIVVLSWPDITLWVLALAGGLSLLLGGVVQVLIAFAHHRRPGWTVDLGLGALGVVLGAIVLAWPEATVVVLAVLFGIRSAVLGAVAIAAGWQLHRLARTPQVAGAA